MWPSWIEQEVQGEVQVDQALSRANQAALPVTSRSDLAASQPQLRGLSQDNQLYGPARELPSPALTFIISSLSSAASVAPTLLPSFLSTPHLALPTYPPPPFLTAPLTRSKQTNIRASHKPRALPPLLHNHVRIQTPRKGASKTAGPSPPRRHTGQSRRLQRMANGHPRPGPQPALRK